MVSFWRLFGWEYNYAQLDCGERHATIKMWSKYDHGYATKLFEEQVAMAIRQGWLVSEKKSTHQPMTKELNKVRFARGE